MDESQSGRQPRSGHDEARQLTVRVSSSIAATGAILDRLGRDELHALIDTIDDLQGGTGLFRKLVSRQGLASPLVRPLLLQYLANRATAE